MMFGCLECNLRLFGVVLGSFRVRWRCGLLNKLLMWSILRCRVRRQKRVLGGENYDFLKKMCVCIS